MSQHSHSKLFAQQSCFFQPLLFHPSSPSAAISLSFKETSCVCHWRWSLLMWDKFSARLLTVGRKGLSILHSQYNFQCVLGQNFTKKASSLWKLHLWNIPLLIATNQAKLCGQQTCLLPYGVTQTHVTRQRGKNVNRFWVVMSENETPKKKLKQTKVQFLLKISRKKSCGEAQSVPRPLPTPCSSRRSFRPTL